MQIIICITDNCVGLHKEMRGSRYKKSKKEKLFVLSKSACRHVYIVTEKWFLFSSYTHADKVWSGCIGIILWLIVAFWKKKCLWSKQISQFLRDSNESLVHMICFKCRCSLHIFSCCWFTFCKGSYGPLYLYLH